MLKLHPEMFKLKRVVTEKYFPFPLPTVIVVSVLCSVIKGFIHFNTIKTFWIFLDNACICIRISWSYLSSPPPPTSPQPTHSRNYFPTNLKISQTSNIDPHRLKWFHSIWYVYAERCSVLKNTIRKFEVY